MYGTWYVKINNNRGIQASCLFRARLFIVSRLFPSIQLLIYLITVYGVILKPIAVSMVIVQNLIIIIPPLFLTLQCNDFVNKQLKKLKLDS